MRTITNPFMQRVQPAYQFSKQQEKESVAARVVGRS
jgi:hypothetical protein